MVKFDQMWFIFQHSLPGAPWSTHFFHQCCSVLILCGIEAFILILKKVLNCMTLSSRSDTASHPSVIFSCWGSENSHMVPNQENVEGDQPAPSHSHVHVQQPLQPQTRVQLSIVLVKQDSLRQFSRLFWNVFSKLLSKVLNYFNYPDGFIWKETILTVSIRKGWI